MRYLLLSVILLSTLCACGKSQPASNYPIAQQAAIVDAGHFVRSDNPGIPHIRYLLKSLHAATGYSKQKIADQAAATRDIMRKRFGSQVTILKLLEAANGSKAVQTGAVKLEEFFGLYAALSGQQSGYD